MTIEALYEIYRRYPSVNTDTRKIQAGDLFFALKGSSFNGNAFAKKAIEAGSEYAIIDDDAFTIPGKTILVPDALACLQQLALYHRQQFNIPFLAITGSNGKTTTKELVHSVLSARWKTYTTEGNLNNHIGIPLTLLKIKKDAELAVIEMGANHQREIAGYCTYTRPTHGIITNCGKAHLEGFGGVEGVRKGKGELYDFLRENKGTAFVMWDFDYLQSMSRGILSVIRYGTSPGLDLVGRVLTAEPFLKVEFLEGTTIKELKTRLVGDYNLSNVLAAVAVGRYFNVREEAIKEAVESYAPANNRSQLIRKNTLEIVMDAYNANPNSMRAAIENFGRQHPENKVLVLGAMAELGDDSREEHEQIIRLIGQYPWKAVALVGGDFQKIDHPYHRFENSGEAGRWFQQQNFQNAGILLKGSRSMAMEKVVE